MLRKSVLLAIGMLFGALLLAGASGASSVGYPPLGTVRFQISTGPTNGIRPGRSVIYQLGLVNIGKKALSNLRIDLFLPKQTIDKGTARLYPAPGDVVVSRIVKPNGMTPYAPPASCSAGVHLCWTLKRFSPLGGPEILVNTHILKGASGVICDKLMLTYAGKKYDNSPACVKLGKGV